MQGMRFRELLQGKKAMITDLDGTLVDLRIDWDSLREKVKREMGWDHPLKPLGVSIPLAAKDEEEMRRAFDIVEKSELEAASKAEPDPHLRDLLVEVKRMGLRLGLITMQASRSAVLVLVRIGINDLFDVIVTRDYSLDRRAQLSYAMRKMSVKGEECIFLGDMPWDVYSGKELGCFTICVGKAIEGADTYLESIKELRID